MLLRTRNKKSISGTLWRVMHVFTP